MRQQSNTIYFSLILACFYIFPNILFAQFDPPAGEPGSLAIPATSSLFVNWARGGQATLGPMDISQPHLGNAQSGVTEYAFGNVDGITVSLGDGGNIILSFEHPIRNGDGADFAVFENAFNNTFLELAFVEVSSDGQHFVRFPATSNTDTSIQIDPFGSVDATLLNNLAGKYQAGYGTPFDLEDLIDSTILDLENIRYIKIIDAIGSMQSDFASRDHLGQKVNDPWPTPFPSSGFDLDAVGVIHENKASSILQPTPSTTISIYPNPLNQGNHLQIESTISVETVHIYNTKGQLIKSAPSNALSIDTQGLQPGLYQLILNKNNQAKAFPFLIIE